MTKNRKWQEDHPSIRFYSESVAWKEKLEQEAAAASLSLGDYIKHLLAARSTIAERAASLTGAPGGIECCFCHNLLPDHYLTRKLSEREELLRLGDAPEITIAVVVPADLPVGTVFAADGRPIIGPAPPPASFITPPPADGESTADGQPATEQQQEEAHAGV